MSRRRRRRRPPRHQPPDDFRLEGSTVPEPEPEPQDAELLLGLIAGLRDELTSGQMFIAGRGDGGILIGMVLTRGEGGLSLLAEHQETGRRPWDGALADLADFLDTHAKYADGVRVVPRPDAERRAHDTLDWVLKATDDPADLIAKMLRDDPAELIADMLRGDKAADDE